MWGKLGIIPLLIGIVGVAYQSLIFVKQTIPENYGNNPGFGCFETMILPWLALACIGIGLLLWSWIWAVCIFMIGMFCFGFLASWLSRTFGSFN